MTKSFSPIGKIIIEEYIEGPEYSVESITQGGETHIIAITEKTTNGYPYFVETRHILPAKLNLSEQLEISSIVTNTLKAIELDNSIAHTELKLTSKGASIIELGGRFGGDYICTDLVEIATGISMYENLINIVLGEKVNTKNTLRKFAGIQFVDSFNAEKVSKNHNKILNDVNLGRYEYYNKRNNNKLTNSTDRLGYYIFSSDNRESLLTSLNNLEK